jgi:hypothetical protein
VCVHAFSLKIIQELKLVNNLFKKEKARPIKVVGEGATR